MTRQAKSLDVLVRELDRHAPHRSTRSDGGLGDTRHQQAVSDHNPNAAGVWRARDVTVDPKGGMPGEDLADRVAKKLGKHPALKSGAYVIYNRRIISADRIKEGWRAYVGSDAHTGHVHISVATAAAGYDSTMTWNLWPLSRLGQIRLLAEAVIASPTVPKSRKLIARAVLAALGSAQ